MEGSKHRHGSSSEDSENNYKSKHKKSYIKSHKSSNKERKEYEEDRISSKRSSYRKEEQSSKHKDSKEKSRNGEYDIRTEKRKRYDSSDEYEKNKRDYSKNNKEMIVKESTKNARSENQESDKYSKRGRKLEDSDDDRRHEERHKERQERRIENKHRSKNRKHREESDFNESDEYESSNRHHKFRSHNDKNYNETEKRKHTYSDDDTLKKQKDNDRHLRKYEEIENHSNVEKPPNTVEKVDSTEPLSKRQKIANINMKISGNYIPPARLKMLQESIQDKSSEAYQRVAWEALKKSIIGMTNKVNSSNIRDIVQELFKENIIRGRGILTRSLIQAQALSPTYTNVYAAFVAVINSKFPEVGALLIKRLVLQYKRGFRRNDKSLCMSSARFLAHLLNQEVIHEILILEMITHLMENPTNHSIEIAISALKECGLKVKELMPKGMQAICSQIRSILHEGSMEARTKYMIEVFFAINKDGFKDFVPITPELDLVEEEDKNTHLINLDDAVDSCDILNVFKFDPDYMETEENYKSIVKEILGDSDDEEGSGDEDDSGDDDEEGEDEEKEKEKENQEILDMTETNQVCLRRKIYLTIQSSLDFEECAHKLLKLELKPGQILEMCYMILDCCAQQRTYEKFFGLLAQRFCRLNKIYVEPFTQIFENSYNTIHRLETNKLRNVAKFFAHLLYTDAISWMVLATIKLNEEDTTSSSRIFIKILFQELSEFMGLTSLNERVKDVTLQEAFEGLFPRDHPHNTRFAINFFTSIGLGGLTDDLREHLKTFSKNPPPVPTEIAAAAAAAETSSSSSSSDSSSDSSSSDSSSDSSSESSSSESDNTSKKKKQRKKKR